MNRWIAALPLALGCFACSRDTSHDLDPGSRNDTARERLAAADFAGARDEYRAVLDADPNNAEASFGWAFTDLMLLPDAAPVKQVLDRCGQPGFEVGTKIFGPNGVLAQEEAALAGSANLSAHARDNATAGATDLRFAPDGIRSQVYESTDVNGVTRRHLYVSLRERSQDPRWFTIQLNVDDVEQNDTDTTPLADGVRVALTDIDGYVDLYLPNDFGGYYSNVLGGTLIFHRAGTRPGDTLQIELENVVLPAICPEPTCDRRYEISGTIDDTVSARIEFDEDDVPFGTLDDDAGPPQRDALIVAIDLCARPLSTAYLADQLQQVGDLMQADSAALQAVINSADAASFQFTLPKALLHSRVDMTINLSDVLALKSMVDGASALADLAAQYTYLQGDLHDLITDHDIWVDGDFGPETRLQRGMAPAALAMALDVAYLERDPSFNLDTFRTRLQASLSAAAGALRNRASQRGIFNFQAPASKRLADEMADGLDAIRTSIDGTDVVALPSAPLYGFALGRFFANPLDQSRLEELSGINPLWQRRAGDPSASTAAGRNDSLAFTWGEALAEGTSDQLIAWTGGVLALPRDRSNEACGAGCGDGYVCGGADTCQAVLPYLATELAWETAQVDVWPVFVDPQVRDAFAFGF